MHTTPHLFSSDSLQHRFTLRWPHRGSFMSSPTIPKGGSSHKPVSLLSPPSPDRPKCPNSDFAHMSSVHVASSNPTNAHHKSQQVCRLQAPHRPKCLNPNFVHTSSLHAASSNRTEADHSKTQLEQCIDFKPLKGSNLQIPILHTHLLHMPHHQHLIQSLHFQLHNHPQLNLNPPTNQTTTMPSN
jgi:hypothetical protein